MSSRRILVVCAIIIILGLGILAVDRWIVGRDEPSSDERLLALVEDFGLTLHRDGPEVEALRRDLVPFQETTGNLDELGPVLSRTDGGRRLWLFEFVSRERAIRRAGRPDVSIDVVLFGILFDLGPGPNLQPWTQARDARPPTPPHTLQSLSRLGRLGQYHMAISGRHILFVSTLQTWALQQAIDRQISVEFHPGLFNSAMKIDVQVALETVNAMQVSAEPFGDFYRVDTGSIDLPSPDSDGLRLSLEKSQRRIQEQLDADMQALRDRMAKQREENRAQLDATLREFRENMRANNARLRERTLGSDSAGSMTADPAPEATDAATGG